MRLPVAVGSFLLVVFCKSAYGEFKPDFSQWLAQRFGEDVRNNLERRDLGTWGSFGGRTSPEEPIRNQPVVFVHGVSNRACDKMKQAADFFFNHGYTFAELYGTTYANGDQGNPLQ
uniref:Hydrolase_4 domain-containing protein n=1 Tax=Globodera pallida TaxID=36090 RepID=A0A183BWC0_GLOPA